MKGILVFFSLVSVFSNVTAQSPGGFSSNLLLWLKADAGTSCTTNGCSLSQWNDQSSNAFACNQSTGSDQPLLTSSSINFNPTVSFDGSDDHMIITGGILSNTTYNDVNVYAVRVINTVKLAANFYENSSLSKLSTNIPFSDANAYWDAGDDQGTNRLSTSWGGSTGIPYLWANNFSTSGATPDGNHQDISRDGLSIASDASGSSFDGINNDFYLGSNADPTNFDHADLAELIIYSGVITSTQHQRIESYLGIKYGISIDQSSATDYLASDGSTAFWDASNNVGYDHGIFGIGRDDNSGLDQRISKNTASGSILSLSLDNDFSASNGSASRTTAHTNNLQFLILAHNDDPTSIQTTEVDLVTYTGRTAREWKVEKTANFSQNVHLRFEGFETTALDTFYLLRDADGNFSSGATVIDTLDENGIVTNTSLSDGEYLTLAVVQSPRHPGGVSTDLIYWQKANEGTNTTTDGEAITLWGDQNNTGHNATNITSPLYEVTGDNYNPTIDFSSGNLGLTIADHEDINSTLSSYTEKSMSVEFRTNSDISTRQIIYEQGGANNGINIYIDGGSIYASIWDNNVISASGSRAIAANTSYIITFIFDGGNSFNAFINGDRFLNDVAVIASLGAHIGDIGIGQMNQNTRFHDGTSIGAGEYFEGSISEISHYNHNVSLTERQRIESYMALKYGITLDNSDGGTAGDYLLSDGSTIWDASLSSGYHNDVIGLIRDDNSGITQKQSAVEDDTTVVYISSLSATNKDNNGVIGSDGSALIVGHNQGKMCGTVTSFSERPFGAQSRIEREWKLTNTNFSGSYNLDISLSACAILGSITDSDLRLLVDEDGNFSDATVFESGSGLSISNSGGVISISGISTNCIPMNSTRYITLASSSISTPLPITLLSFTANETANGININWQTASEVNNDYFTVERSINGYDWETLLTIEGAGNSNTVLSYAAVDRNPYHGHSYYRLKQTDFDGQFSYSKITSAFINYEQKSLIRIYPNPTNGLIKVSASNLELKFITIQNTFRQDITHKAQIKRNGDSSFLIDLSRLPSGLYFIKTRSNVTKVLKY